MAEYKTKGEYGRGQLSRKQVCAMNYTSGEMPPHFKWMHFRLSSAYLCLQSQTALCLVDEPKTRNKRNMAKIYKVVLFSKNLAHFYVLVSDAVHLWGVLLIMLHRD